MTGKRKIPTSLGWWGIAVAAICTLGLFFMVGTTAVETGKGSLAMVLVMALGIVATMTALFAAEPEPKKPGFVKTWAQPKRLSLLFVAIFAGFGTMTNALALLAPRAATESAPGTIENSVEQILAKVAPPPRAARIRTKLPGIWGEPGCAVTYRFRIVARALVVESLRRPAGAASYRLVATIGETEGDAMNTVVEEPLSARGSAVTFSYATNDVTERLTWADRTRPVPLELDRCR